jgi:hypothetical protein
MPIGTRAKLASMAVALLVTAIVGAPTLALDGAGPADETIHALAKPTQKPRPSHPHATAAPTPTVTPQPTPAPTPKPTAKPNATVVPAPTPRATDRPRRGDETPKPSRKPGKGSVASADPTASGTDDGGLSVPGAGGAGATGSRGPSPGLLGLATFLAAVVGLATLWFLTRSRRRAAALTPVAARVQAAPPQREAWLNAGLDDDAALPEWLRLNGEPEPAQLAHVPPRVPLPPFEPEPVPSDELEPHQAPALREPHHFADPIGDSGMRLIVEATGSALLDQPNQDVGVVLATLVAGDEVEVQDLEDPWVRVVTPVGATGWIRGESLGFGAPAPGEAAVPAGHEPGVEEPGRSAHEPPAPPTKRRGMRLPRRARSAGQPS